MLTTRINANNLHITRNIMLLKLDTGQKTCEKYWFGSSVTFEIMEYLEVPCEEDSHMFMSRPALTSILIFSVNQLLRIPLILVCRIVQLFNQFFISSHSQQFCKIALIFLHWGKFLCLTSFIYMVTS